MKCGEALSKRLSTKNTTNKDMLEDSALTHHAVSYARFY